MGSCSFFWNFAYHTPSSTKTTTTRWLTKLKVGESCRSSPFQLTHYKNLQRIDFPEISHSSLVFMKSCVIKTMHFSQKKFQYNWLAAFRNSVDPKKLKVFTPCSVLPTTFVIVIIKGLVKYWAVP